MKNFYLLIKSINSKLKILLKTICAIFMALITLIVLYGVLTRYLFGTQPAFTEELARMFLIELTFFGAALAFAEGSHIGLDYLSGKFTENAKRFCAVLSGFITMFFVCGFLIYGGCEFVKTSINTANKLVSVNVDFWVVYLCVPISGIFSIMFLLENFLKNILNVSEEK